MDLPGILHQSFTAPGEGVVELCPEAYDLGRIGEMLATALAECEHLVLEQDGTIEPPTR